MKLRIDFIFFIMTLKPVFDVTTATNVVKREVSSDDSKVVSYEYKDHEVTYGEAKENIREPRTERTYQDCPVSCRPYTEYCHSKDFLEDHCELKK